MKMLAQMLCMISLCAALSACASNGIKEWKEEVLLHDGSKLIVERSVERGGRHEIGQEPPIKEQSLTFVLPGTSQNVTWEDKFTADVGGANFLPMQLEISKDTPYLVVVPMGCLAYNKWGRPNPPYVVFKYQGGAWQRIPLRELSAELTIPNMIFSSPDTEARKSGQRVVSAETIKTLYGRYKQPEYRTILRKPLANASGRCGELVYDGNGGWIGMGWFRDQPTYEACLKYCERKQMDAQYCPCGTLFKGK